MSADESDVYDFDTRRDAGQRVRWFCARLVLRPASRHFIPERSFEAVTIPPVLETSGMIRVKPFPLSGTDTPRVEPRHVTSDARIFNVRAKAAKTGYGMPLAMKESVRWKKNSR